MFLNRALLQILTMGAFIFTTFGTQNLLAQTDSPNSGSLETDVDTTDAPVVVEDRRIPFPTNAEIAQRLDALPQSCIQTQLTGAVKGYINTYAIRKRAKCEAMLGRRMLYFPMFERYLKAHGMPAELKYLSVVESALNPTIESSAGAMGLWQFMPATGAEYGLKITRWCDERQDPNQSTEAAMKYLKHLHKQFDSWELALAAYNSGPNRVANAIKRAHSRNFWRLQRYLPAETANYVPAFIAAMYICHYFPEHNLEPEAVDLDKQMTESVRVFETTTFSDVASATGIEYFLVKDLNPAYRQNFFPQSSEGNFITVPKRVIPAFLRWLSDRAGKEYYAERPIVFAQFGAVKDKYVASNYAPSLGETLESVANLFGVEMEQIRLWNNLPWGYLSPNIPVKIFQPVGIRAFSDQKIEGPKKVDPKAKMPENAAVSPQKDQKTTTSSTSVGPDGRQKTTTIEVVTKPKDRKKEDVPPAKPADKKLTKAEKKAGKNTVQNEVKKAEIEPFAAGEPMKKMPEKAFEKIAAPASSDAPFHIVCRGEKAEDIAKKYGLTVDELKLFNPKMRLDVGSKIRLKPQ